MTNTARTVDRVLALLDELERILADVRSAARTIIDDEDQRKERRDDQPV